MPPNNSKRSKNCLRAAQLIHHVAPGRYRWMLEVECDIKALKNNSDIDYSRGNLSLDDRAERVRLILRDHSWFVSNRALLADKFEFGKSGRHYRIPPQLSELISLIREDAEVLFHENSWMETPTLTAVTMCDRRAFLGPR